MISPFKAVVGGEYKLVERRLLSAILLRFGLNAHLHEELVEGIKAADREAAYHEATRIAGFGASEARRLFGAPKIALDLLGDFFEPLRPDEVERAVSRALWRTRHRVDRRIVECLACMSAHCRGLRK